MFAKVIINNRAKELNKTFDYQIPENLKDSVRLGSRVFVSFGRAKTDGYVIDISDKSDYECKFIDGIYDNNDLDENRVKLAKIMAKRYFCNLSDCLKLMINPETSSNKEGNRLKDRTIKYISFNEKIFEDILNTKVFDVKFEDTNQKEYVESMKVIKNAKEFQKYKLTEKQILAIMLLRKMQSENESSELYDKNSKIKYLEYKEAYPFGDSIITSLTKKEIFVKEELDAEYDDFNFNNSLKKGDDFEVENDLVLNKEQKKVYDDISFDIDFSVFSENLIFGVTGSRKNRNISSIN